MFQIKLVAILSHSVITSQEYKPDQHKTAWAFTYSMFSSHRYISHRLNISSTKILTKVKTNALFDNN